MSTTLQSALLITAVGMGLVFAAIIFLWGLMAAMVRLGAEREDAGEKARLSPASDDGTNDEESDVERERRKRAAALAVAVAMASARRPLGPFPLPPTAFVSPWQSVMRVNQIKHRRGRQL